MISGILLKNKGTKDKDIYYRLRYSFKKEQALIEGTAIQPLEGRDIFDEHELDSYKYKIDTKNNGEFLLVDEQKPGGKSIKIDAKEVNAKNLIFFKNQRNKKHVISGRLKIFDFQSISGTSLRL